MFVTSRDGSRQVHLKWFQGLDYITMQVFKQSWRIPEGTEARIELAFDGEHFSGGQSTAFKAATGWSYLAINIKTPDLIKSFLKEFQGANKMTLSFPDGSETPWDAEMDGSRRISGVWMDCVARINKPTTQPHGKQPETSQPHAPTQPHNAPSASQPTQPFERKPVIAPQAGERGA